MMTSHHPPAGRASRRAFLRLAGLASASGALLAAACADTGPAVLATPAPLPTAPAQTAPAQPAGGRDRPLRIGLVATLSGAYAAAGAQMRDGLALYLDQVGRSAGGRPIDVVLADETDDPSVGLRRIRKLVEEDRVDVVTGIVHTATAYAAREYLHAAGRIAVIAGATGNEITRSLRSPAIFRTSASVWQNSAPAGEWAARALGKRCYVVVPETLAGHEAADAFGASFRAAGGRVLDVLLPKPDSIDYGPFLPRIAAARPDVVFCSFAGADAVTFTQQYQLFGLRRDVPLLGTGEYVDEGLLAAEGGAALGARGALPWAWSLDTPANRTLIADFAGRYGRRPDTYVVQQYDAARCIVEAVDRVDGDTSDRDGLVRALEAAQMVTPRGPLRFDPASHNPIQNVYLREVRDVGGALHNVVVATFEDVRDPG